jgi:hypothetical protein
MAPKERKPDGRWHSDSAAEITLRDSRDREWLFGHFTSTLTAQDLERWKLSCHLFKPRDAGDFTPKLLENAHLVRPILEQRPSLLKSSIEKTLMQAAIHFKVFGASRPRGPHEVAIEQDAFALRQFILNMKEKAKQMKTGTRTSEDLKVLVEACRLGLARQGELVRLRGKTSPCNIRSPRKNVTGEDSVNRKLTFGLPEPGTTNTNSSCSLADRIGLGDHESAVVSRLGSDSMESQVSAPCTPSSKLAPRSPGELLLAAAPVQESQASAPCTPSPKLAPSSPAERLPAAADLKAPSQDLTLATPSASVATPLATPLATRSLGSSQDRLARLDELYSLRRPHVATPSAPDAHEERKRKLEILYGLAPSGPTKHPEEVSALAQAMAEENIAPASSIAKADTKAEKAAQKAEQLAAERAEKAAHKAEQAAAEKADKADKKARLADEPAANKADKTAAVSKAKADAMEADMPPADASSLADPAAAPEAAAAPAAVPEALAQAEHQYVIMWYSKTAAVALREATGQKRQVLQLLSCGRGRAAAETIAQQMADHLRAGEEIPTVKRWGEKQLAKLPVL